MASQYYQQLTGEERHKRGVVAFQSGIASIAATAGITTASNSPPRRSSDPVSFWNDFDAA